MRKFYLSLALLLIFCWVLPAQSTTLFQTTTPPSAGVPAGSNITSTAFIGNYFQLNSAAHVDSVSTAAAVNDNGTIFGAILNVADFNSLPAGTPFGTASTPLATTILRPSSTIAPVSGAVSVDLPAGKYIVVFGTGLFGASSGIATLGVSDGAKTSLPTGANQVNWGQSCNNGTIFCWSIGFPAPSPFYFAVSGSGSTGGQASISSLNPNFASPGGSAFTLTVNGSGFQPNSIISWAGINLSTTYVAAAQLTAVVPANLIANSGTANVTVTTNGIATQPAVFTIGASNGPKIDSVTPNVIPPGTPGVVLTVNGSGFGPGANVLWNGSPLFVTNNSTTQLTAMVSSALLTNLGAAAVVVQNANGVSSNPVTVIIGQPSTVPTLTSFSPSSATVGSGAFTLSVTGTNYTTSSAVLWNGSLLPTTFITSTQLNATVPANLLTTATNANIAVNNPGTGTSNTLAFPIVVPSGPAISSLNPTSVAPGGSSFLLTVNGSNFSTSSAVLWNGSLLATNYISPTQLMASVNASLITAAASVNITVSNPGNLTSNAQVFTVSATPPPVLSSLSPSSAAPGGPSFTITVNGSNFAANSAIVWNGSLLATTFVTGTQLTANVAASLIASAGTANVTVMTPSSGTSGALTFSIAAPTGPSITTLSPSSAAPGGPSFILTVTGTGFTSGSMAQWNGNPLVTIVTSATQLQASVSGTLIASAGTANVTVLTGTTTSNALAFTIGAANTPAITTLSPSSATVGGAQFTLTINGSNFASGASVVWNGGLLSTTFVSATQLTAVVPASLIAAVGSANVTVINPTGTSTTSNGVTFTVTNLASPTLSSMSPATTAAAGPQFTLTINGQNFLAGAAVRWNGSTLTTTLVSSNQLTAVVPASLIAAAGTATITVANPGGAISNSLTFTITSGASANTLFQTTLPPTSGQPASASLSTGQFLGNYFVLSAPAHIDSISTYAQASDGGTIFGAIVSVPNLTTPPSGNPFDGTTVVSATLRPGASSSIVSAPVSADLPAGTYAIVFGSGYFGATSTSAFTAFSNGGSANVPAGWNQVSWGLYCGGGLNTCWNATFTSASQFYFAVTGTSTSPQSLSITNLNPTSVTAGAGAFTLTVNGTGFGSGSTVQWNGSSLATNVLSQTQLTAQVPSTLVANVGVASITVLNINGSISNASTFTISSPSLSITSLNPPSAAVGGPAFTLTVTGSGFANGSSVQWNGTSLQTTFVSSTQLTVTVPANLIANPGTASVTVLNPAGTFSNFLSFTISSASLSINSVSPTTIVAGSPAFTLVVTGSGFLIVREQAWARTCSDSSMIRMS